MKKIYIVAAACAIICGILLFDFFKGISNEQPIVVQDDNGETLETVEVVVANVDIEEFTVITADMVRVAEMPAVAVHADAVRKIDDVVGKVIKDNIIADEIILMPKVSAEGSPGTDNNAGSGSSLSYQVPRGKRAMTITVDTNSGIGGYIETGDLVDVMCIQTTTDINNIDFDKVSGGKHSYSDAVVSTILECIKVIKLGDVTTDGKGGKPYGVVTLELTPQQCEAIYAAETTGTLRLVLRAKGDVDRTNPKMIITKDFMK